MQMELTAVFEPQEDGWIVGSIAELPGVLTQGRSFEEVRENLADAMREIFLGHRDMALAEKQPNAQTERLAVEVAGLP